MNAMTWNKGEKRSRTTILAAMAGVLLTSGCIVADGGGGGGGYYHDTPPPQSVNYPPEFASIDVYCDYDSYYLDYYWDFTADVYDPDGAVVDVYLDIYDYYSDEYLESFALDPDVGDLWYARVYETYSAYLTCPYVEDYIFEFYAVDDFGDATGVIFGY